MKSLWRGEIDYQWKGGTTEREWKQREAARWRVAEGGGSGRVEGRWRIGKGSGRME